MQNIEILLGLVGREYQVGVQDLPLVDKLVSLISCGNDNTQIGAGTA